MNLQKKIFLVLILLTISACQHSPQGSSNLIGAWHTTTCEQLSDGSGNAINAWAKGVYTFTQDGNLNYYADVYTDSGCTLSNGVDNRANSPALIYQDLGATTLQEGIDGHKLSIQFSDLPNSYQEGYFVFQNNELCFSKSFSFDATSFQMSPEQSTAIDFTQCLQTTS